MSKPSEASDAGALQLLRGFAFERVLDEDPRLHNVNLLGTISHPDRFPDPVPAILLASKTPFDSSDSALKSLAAPSTELVKSLGSNDVYNWMLAWRRRSEEEADAKINLIVPATDVHIRKYSAQVSKMVRETPELYRSVVLPYIDAFPPSRMNWVYNILEHKTESERIVYEDPSPEQGFLILPDLKWDQRTLSSLYLLCLTHNRSVRSLRDLSPAHLPMLRNIRAKAYEAAKAKYGISAGELRMFVHYQPSYYHFHVHITHVDYLGFSGITVGQAHLLDDIIDNLEHESQSETGNREASYYALRTLTYALGENHGLFEKLWEGTQKSNAS